MWKSQRKLETAINLVESLNTGHLWTLSVEQCKCRDLKRKMYNPWISSKDLKKKSDKKQKSRGRWRMKTVFSHTKGKSQTTNVNTAVLRKWTDSKTPCCILNYEVLLTLQRSHLLCSSGPLTLHRSDPASLWTLILPELCCSLGLSRKAGRGSLWALDKDRAHSYFKTVGNSLSSCKFVSLWHGLWSYFVRFFWVELPQ